MGAGRKRRKRRWARAWRWVAAAAVAVLVLGVVPSLCSDSVVYVTDETEALARVIRSEVGASPWQHRVHVAWATRNLAESRRQTVAEMACSPCGPQQAGRPVSSRQAPTDADRDLARGVLAAPKVIDPTGGATQFVNPALQDELAARSVSGYRGRPYSHVRRVWSRSYGWEPYYRLGPDLELWGPKQRRRRVR